MNQEIPQVPLHKDDPEIDLDNFSSDRTFEFVMEDSSPGNVWDNMTVEEKLEKSKVTMMKIAPFFGSILAGLNFINVETLREEAISEEEREEMADDIEDQLPSDSDVSGKDVVDELVAGIGPGTAAVDAEGNFYYDPEYIDSLGSNETISLMAHEVSHIVKMSHFRMDEERMDNEIFNIAHDILINFELDKYGFITSDDWFNPSYNEGQYMVFDPEDYDNLDADETDPLVIEDLTNETAETVYAKIEDWMDENDIEGMGDMNPGGEGGNEIVGRFIPDAGGTSGIDEDLEREVEQSRSRSRTRENGDIGVDIYDQVKSKEKSDTDYRRYIKSMLQSAIPHDYRMHRPHKKSVSLSYHVPDIKKKDGQVRVIVCIDTSGSISEELLEKFGGEIRRLCSQYQQIDIYHIQHTAEVTYAEEQLNVSQYDYRNIEIHGSGGTNHLPVFDHLEDENNYRYSAFVGLTDGYSEFPESKPNHLDDVVWVVPFSGADDKDFPFGEVLRTHDRWKSG